MKKTFEIEEKPLCNAVCTYRERGNYLQRLEQFESAIQAYSEALQWNNADVRSLLGRSLARAKATHYHGALADAATAAELEPQNLSAKQIRAHIEYERCAFERALVLAHQGQRVRRYPPNFAECARHAEETVKECMKHANKMLGASVTLMGGVDMNSIETVFADEEPPNVPRRKSRTQKKTSDLVEETCRIEQQKTRQISRLMASKYLERMAHDKYFLIALCKDERLASANKQGSLKLLELANQARADVEKRQAVLRERRPLYAARAAEAAAKARLFRTRKEQLSRAQVQNINDAQRLVQSAETLQDKRDTTKCLEHVEFAMEQISRKPANLLPGKDKFLQTLQDLVANVFLDQKRVRIDMSESDREKRAFVLLGIGVSREPSRDSVLRTRPPAPPRDAKKRLRTLERNLTTSARSSERCYVLHELARLHVDIKQAQKAHFFAYKCQTESRSSNQRTWLLNASFLLARSHILQNNRPEARATLMEAASLARSYRWPDVADFFETCVNVSMEGELESSDAHLEKREKAMVSIMQDKDLKSAAEHLFRRMSVIPASRRFSVMPGAARVEDVPPTSGRRQSIAPRAQQPTRISHKSRHPLGFQDFDL